MRQRALKELRNGSSKSEVNEMFGVGINTVRTLEKLEAKTGRLEDRLSNRTAYKIDREKLFKYYKEKSIQHKCGV